MACGVFLDFKKMFDMVSREILMETLEYYGVRGTTNRWFDSYLTKRSHRDPPLLFLIYINDLHKSIKYSNVFHFADHTSLIFKHKSPKKLKKLINFDLKFLCKWLHANSIALNTKKTDFIVFVTKTKLLTTTWKLNSMSKDCTLQNMWNT